MRRTITALVGLLLLSSPLLAQPLQCPGGIVDVGDTKEEVAARCGPPTSVQQWDQVQTQEMEFADGGFAEPEVAYPEIEWIYNYGPTRFTSIVRFEGDRVRNIVEGAFGY